MSECEKTPKRTAPKTNIRKILTSHQRRAANPMAYDTHMNRPILSMFCNTSSIQNCVTL